MTSARAPEMPERPATPATPTPDTAETSERRAPVIVGITLRPEARQATPRRQFQNRAYFSAIEAAGGVPLPFPLLKDPSRLRPFFDLCSAIVLPGGPDVDPARYGEDVRADCAVESEADLDETEFVLLRWALETRLPVLCVCRGIQVLNVALGGTLWQDLAVQGATATNHEVEQPRTAISHEVKLDPQSRLSRLLGPDAIETNTIHHQGIRELAPNLRAVGWSEDGLVEAVEAAEGSKLADGRFLFGVQCHPEELVNAQGWAAALFQALVESASR